MTDVLSSSPIPEQVLGESYEKLALFHEKLEREGELRGIIGPRDVDIIWERHILNSAALVPFIKKEINSLEILKPIIGDIGSGGGFPGIIIGTCLSDIDVYLVEPMERRIEWLNEVVAELNLTNVHVIRARAQEVIPGKESNDVKRFLPKNYRGFDIVTCRAVAPMTKLTGMVFPLITSGGKLVALKGRSVDTELEKAAKEMKKYHAVSPHIFDAPVAQGLESTRVLVVNKSSKK
ncbi:16S rRNA (guanine(527)-N(7))-methyltransferase RsmG [Alloscardovia theropitheci]|uniref:Ribosomal RNA small subunit methyltransferase G n=1 Tax=Alloscardovia theropitheci TaxID=2496842 RepID=A0A4R0QXS1_9BIFI|nr:16S rRNA (guanine(527)-N(7))-methyltransferase RsmG [Alloscardovia theropitheci]TCD54291.1 16S rRNA (guanine(527)-N(7))-methyltransferase RsmG [Alloscardovia theropitheci]